jgi:16S rRNA (uracil1498-N3)-methyltransferase
VRLTRVYLDTALSEGTLVTLPSGPAQHLTRVLRLAAGAPLIVFNGQGGEYAATLESVRKDAVLARIGTHDAVERESPLATTLLQGMARGEKMDLILQKATELGVTRIVPVATARSNVRLSGDTARRKQEHWQGVAIGACEQSGRNRVPEVVAPVDYATAIAESDAQLKLILAPDAQGQSLQSLLTAVATGDGKPTLCLLVGPEGGFDPAEVELARRAGYTPCRLGPRVLRTETAALAALAALQFAAGGLA